MCKLCECDVQVVCVGGMHVCVCVMLKVCMVYCSSRNASLSTRNAEPKPRSDSS